MAKIGKVETFACDGCGATAAAEDTGHKGKHEARVKGWYTVRATRWGHDQSGVFHLCSGGCVAKVPGLMKKQIGAESEAKES